MKVPLTVIRPHPPRDGDYLDALERWGELPDKLPIPDAVRYLAHLTRQNPGAILKVVLGAMKAGELRFWGQSGLPGREWNEGMFRILLPFAQKPRIRLGTDGAVDVSAVVDPRGSPHLEAMAVDPREVVALLIARGRKVPDELRHLGAGGAAPKEPRTAGAGQGIGAEPTPEDGDSEPRASAADSASEAAARPLTTRKLAEAFDGIEGRDATGWAKLLGDASACKWALDARLESGARGKRPATWDPVVFALKLERLKSVPRSELRRRFRDEHSLAEWRAEWGRRIAELEAFGLDANDRQP